MSIQRVVGDEFIRKAHLHGLSVIARTVDDPARMRELLVWGTDAIMTNDPAPALRLIRETGVASGR